MNFQDNYAHMSDDDLLMVAASRSELVDEAMHALDAEMKRRGLSYEEARAKKKHVARLEIKELTNHRRSRKRSKYFVAQINGWVMLLFVFGVLALVISLSIYHLVPEKWEFPILTVCMGAGLAVATVQPWLRQTCSFWFSLVISCAVQVLVGYWVSVHFAPSSRNELRGGGFLTIVPGYLVGGTLFLLLQKLRPYQDPNSNSL